MAQTQPKRKKAAAAGTGDAVAPVSVTPALVNTFDNYVVETLARSALKGAPYNPRVLNEAERKKLMAGIKKHGMLAPPTWNKRTGNIVSGHQRISILDALNGSPDYTLQVAVVDLSESEEKEANLLFNNPGAMGDWDLPKLEEMLKDTNVDLIGTGFDMADVYRLFGDAPGRSAGEVDQLAEKLREAREKYEKVQQKTGNRDSVDFYLVVVFRDGAARDEFCATFGLDDNRYQDGRTIQAMLAAPAPAGTPREITPDMPQVAATG